MLVQSGGGNVYAVLADNPDFELAIKPTPQIISTSVFIILRCRFKARTSDVFDPMLVPKQILVGGIERSDNTLRGTVVMKTNFTVDKVGKGFPHIVAANLYENAPALILPDPLPYEKLALTAKDRREDFAHDFAGLVTAAIGGFYPPKDFSNINPVCNLFDFQIAVQNSNDAASGNIQPVPTETPQENPKPDNVAQVNFGVVDKEPKGELDTSSQDD